MNPATEALIARRVLLEGDTVKEAAALARVSPASVQKLINAAGFRVMPVSAGERIRLLRSRAGDPFLQKILSAG